MVKMTATCLCKLHSFLNETIYGTGYLVCSENENSKCIPLEHVDLLRPFLCLLSLTLFLGFFSYCNGLFVWGFLRGFFVLFSQQVYGIPKIVGQDISVYSRI